MTRRAILSVTLIISILSGMLPLSLTPQPVAAQGGLLVTFPGSYVSEIGGQDWTPADTTTQGTDTNTDNVWKFSTTSIPVGSWEFKAAIGGSWDENYGVGGVLNGPNLTITVTQPSEAVHLYYDRRDHYVAVRPGYRIPVIVGDFLSEVGGADWQPSNLTGWLKDKDNNGIYEWTADVPEGTWEYKVALNESWDENYGAGGAPGGGNLSLAIPAGGSRVTFRYNDTTKAIEHTISNNSDLLVTFPGSYVSELGGQDWTPSDQTVRATDTNNDRVWKFITDTLPAGNWEFKATVGGTWDEDYGVGGVPGGPNLTFTTTANQSVHLYYDRRDNYVAVRPGYRIPVIVGSFLSEVGGADWQPSNLTGWLKDKDNDGWYEWTVTIPAGDWEYKVALNESWDENYGAGGVAGGPNISLDLAAPTEVTFRYNDTTREIRDSVNNPASPQPGDDSISREGLMHDSRSDTYRVPFGAVPAGSEVILRFRTYHNDVESVTLRLFNTEGRAQRLVPMTKVASEPADTSGSNPFGFDYWQATVPVGDLLSVTYYRFIVQDGTRTVYYEDEESNDGGSGEMLAESADRSWNIYIYDPNFETPEWAKNAVIYQIFPERFRNGDESNDPTADPSTDRGWFYPTERGHRFPVEPWNTIVPDPEPYSDNQREWWLTYSSTMYGGDLEGVTEKLDYLQDLGITTIYLNPIFWSPSNHKYDGRDFRIVDPAFGGKEAFDELVAGLDARGMKLVLDAVPNHVSSDSPFFDRFGRHATVGACESVDSPYRNWFFFEPANPAGSGVCAGDTNYRAWFGVQTLPQINTSHPEVLSYWFSSQGEGKPELPENTVNYWLEEGADGWRVDVVPDVIGVNPDFFEIWRQDMKSQFPNAMTYSETWSEGDVRDRVLGDEFDSTMNYRFRRVVLGFLRDTRWADNDGGQELDPLTPSQFLSRFKAIEEDYPTPAFQSAMNLLDSHDTNRVLHVLHHAGFTGTGYNRQPTDNFADARHRVSMVAVLQMTLPGAPTIYYGDEVGLTGYGFDIPRDDPYNRQPYPWADEAGYDALPSWRKAQTDLLNHYKSLTALRNDPDHSFLRTGSFDPLLADDANKILAYGRKDGNGAAIVVMNRGTMTRTVGLDLRGYVPDTVALDKALPSGGADVVGVSGVYSLTIPANSFGIWTTPDNTDMDVPAAPANLITVEEGDTSVELRWRVVPGATRYHIYRSILTRGGYRLVGDVAAPAVTRFDPEATMSYVDNGLIPGQTYYYVVKAVRNGLEGAPSNEAVAVPHYEIDNANLQWPPVITHTISAITPTSDIYARLLITGATNLEGALPSVIAQVGYGPDGSNPAVSSAWQWFDMRHNSGYVGQQDEYVGNILPDRVGTFDVAVRFSTTEGRDWIYADRDGTTNGYSTAQAATLIVQASADTTAPAAPLNLREVRRAASRIEIAWNASTASDVHHYEIWRDDVLLTTVPAGTTAYTDLDITQNDVYTYKVRAVDNSFNRSAFSNEIAIKAEQRPVEVVFRVRVPDFTPEGDLVYIVGDNAQAFGAQWNPGATAMTKVSDNLWEYRVSLDEGVALQYKFTRGSWERVEWWGTLTGTANRTVTVQYGENGVQTIELTVENWRDLLVVDTSVDNSGTMSTNLVVRVSVTMNRQINPASVATDTITVTNSSGVRMPGVTTYISQTMSLVWTPNSPLPAGTYRARVNPGTLVGVDNDGVGLLTPYEFTFSSLATAVRVDDFAVIPASRLPVALLGLTLAAGLGLLAWRRRRAPHE